jgi:hypothetical protein
MRVAFPGKLQITYNLSNDSDRANFKCINFVSPGNEDDLTVKATNACRNLKRGFVLLLPQASSFCSILLMCVSDRCLGFNMSLL